MSGAGIKHVLRPLTAQREAGHSHEDHVSEAD